MSHSTELGAHLYVDPQCFGFCTIISNQSQMGYKHTHDYFEAFLVIKGSATHHVNGSNFNLEPGSLVLLRPHDNHCYLPPVSEGFQFINLIILPQIMKQVFDYLGSGFNANDLLNDQNPTQRNLSNSQFEPLATAFEQLMILPKTNKDRYNTTFKLVVTQIMAQFFNESIFDNDHSYPGWIKRLILEMKKIENYSRGLSAMCEVSQYTHEHLCRAFKKYLNTSPTTFLNDIRIEEAARRIVYTEEPFIDIAQEVGFGNLSHFYHLFKSKYNMSPAKYRKHSKTAPIPQKATMQDL